MMTKNLFRWAIAACGLASVIPLTSCVYDPYYGGGGQASYSSYGGGSSSVFISTGDSRWGYDPYCHSYYDYGRRAYYDPYRYGYYPVGYRPPIVYGVPHPYGWRPGYCPPPRRVNYITLRDYNNRGDAYRRMNYSWARNVQQRENGRSFNPPGGPGGYRGNRDGRDFRNDRDRDGRPNSPIINRPQRPDSGNGFRPSQDRSNGGRDYRTQSYTPQRVRPQGSYQPSGSYQRQIQPQQQQRSRGGDVSGTRYRGNSGSQPSYRPQRSGGSGQQPGNTQRYRGNGSGKSNRGDENSGRGRGIPANPI